MLKYSATLSSAKAYAEAGKLDVWIHLYLNEEGRNIPFSDGLKLFDRYYISPALFPISLFKRCTGPEPEMKYQIHPEWWAHRIAELEKSIQKDDDMPPLIVHYVDGEFELNDGNHRHKASYKSCRTSAKKELSFSAPFCRVKAALTPVSTGRSLNRLPMYSIMPCSPKVAQKKVPLSFSTRLTSRSPLARSGT